MHAQRSDDLQMLQLHVPKLRRQYSQQSNVGPWRAAWEPSKALTGDIRKSRVKDPLGVD